jgi:hypothetical protein
MKKVVSLSWFRHGNSGYEQPASGTSQGIFFLNFMRSVVRAHHAAFPDWQLRIHHDDRVTEFPYFNVLRKMHLKGLLKLEFMGKADLLAASMLWRLWPIYDPSVEVVAFRDIDSLPMHRDYKMLEQFVANSRATLHVLHDSESHSGPLMGGLTACKVAAVRSILPKEEFERQLVAWNTRLVSHGADQHFMNELIYPKLAKDLLIHTRRNTMKYVCYRALPVFPQETELDNAIRHSGAAYDTEKVMEILSRTDYPNKALIEECEL